MTTAGDFLLIDIAADPVCPWCHVGLAAFARARRERLADLRILPRYRAYQLGPDTPPEGVDRQAYYETKFPDAALRQGQREALARAARDAGFEFDPMIPRILPNTLKAHAVIREAHFSGRQDAVAAAIYDRYWNHGDDIGADDVLRAAARNAGLDDDAIDRALTEGLAPAARDAAGMRAAGVTGVPTFIIGERTGFAGALPPDELAHAIRDAASNLHRPSEEAQSQ